MKTILVLILSLITTQVNAFEAIKCPAKKDKLSLVSIDIYDGNPQKGYMQGPENENADFPHVWTIKKNVIPWAVCVYDKHSRKKLVQQKIKKPVSTCEMKESIADSKNFDLLECQEM